MQQANKPSILSANFRTRNPIWGEVTVAFVEECTKITERLGKSRIEKLFQGRGTAPITQEEVRVRTEEK